MRLTRTAAGGAALTLVAGATAILGGANPVAAAPTSVATVYTCTAGTTEDLGTGFSMELPPESAAGSAVPGRPVAITVTFPESLIDSIRGRTMGGTITSLSYRVGGTSVPMSDATISPSVVPATGSLTVSATSQASGFTAPSPGVYDVQMPLTYSMLLTVTDIPTPVGVVCALKSGFPSKLGTMTVKSSSTVAVKVKPKPVTTAIRAKLKVKVTAASGAVPTGKVVARLGKKVLKKGTLTGGKATLKLPKLKAGKRKVVVTYEGDAGVLGSKKKVVINVKP